MTAHAPPLKARATPATPPVERVEALLAGRRRDSQIDHLCDTRALHRLLARLSSHRRPHGAVGRYRVPGEPVYVLVNLRPEAPMVHLTCPAERVPAEMAFLGERIRALLTDPPETAQQHSELAAILATFFRIHPYRDGNGRIARILFRRIALLLGLPLNDRWTLEDSAYGGAMSLSVECFPLSPKPLETFLKRFFD